MPSLPAPLAAELQRARTLDAADALASLRERFALPVNARGQPKIYLCGHSLGLAPRAARTQVETELDDWERLGVEGHTRAHVPWIDYAEQLQAGLALVAGAQAREVVAMNALTVNLHLLLASFYRPAAGRTAILIEAGAFSSDRHAVAAQIAWHGLDPGQELIELAPRPGETLIRAQDIEARIEQEAPRLALVLWPAVQYLTGQAFDVGRITRAAHRAGCPAGFDLAHAIGNVSLSLHADQADFAAWCSYKYLNGGPGSIGGAFIHERHLERPELPRLRGWWGHDAGSRFELSAGFAHADGAAAWALSNPPILSAAPLRASLPLFALAGLPALRDKSVALSGYLETLVSRWVGGAAQLITPSEPSERGCQLSLRLRGCDGSRLLEALHARDVVGDWRAPDVLRLAPVPLYNRFEDVALAGWQLAEALHELGGAEPPR